MSGRGRGRPRLPEPDPEAERQRLQQQFGRGTPIDLAQFANYRARDWTRLSEPRTNVGLPPLLTLTPRATTYIITINTNIASENTLPALTRRLQSIARWAFGTPHYDIFDRPRTRKEGGGKNFPFHQTTTDPVTINGINLGDFDYLTPRIAPYEWATVQLLGVAARVESTGIGRRVHQHVTLTIGHRVGYGLHLQRHLIQKIYQYFLANSGEDLTTTGPIRSVYVGIRAYPSNAQEYLDEYIRKEELTPEDQAEHRARLREHRALNRHEGVDEDLRGAAGQQIVVPPAEPLRTTTTTTTRK